MSKSLFVVSLCLLLLSPGFPASADQYDDCLDGCKQSVAPCSEQARLTAGNVQDEQNLIAACESSKNDCLTACRNAEAQPEPPPQEQPEPQPN